MANLPEWIKVIFAREFNPSSKKELTAEVKAWLNDTGEYSSLWNFYKDLENKTIQKEAIKHDPAAFTITNYGEGSYLNCNGIAAITAIKGKLHFGRTFEVVIDYKGGKQPDGRMEEFKSHVSISDGKNHYGGRPNYNNMKTHVLPERSLALIYMLSEAYIFHKSGNYSKSRSIASRIEKEIEDDPELGCKYFKRRLSETNSNF